MTTEATTRRILSIDGGGIKGVLPAAFLARIEEATKKRIADHFDLIVGTSTGGIIALGLGLGMTSAEILELYETEAASIFPRGGPKKKGFFAGFTPEKLRRRTAVKYDPAPLRSVLEARFGERRLGDSTVRLVIPAYHPDRRAVHVFKTAHHPRFELDWQTAVVDVAMATAAAPTYFPAHATANGEILVDGGVWTNNPVGAAAVEAIGVLGWGRESLRVLSIGCTESAYAIPHESSDLALMLSVTEIFMQGQSKGSLGTAALLTGHSHDSKRLFRYSPVVTHELFALDDIEKISRLKSLGVAEAREALPGLRDIFFQEPAERFTPFHPREKASIA